ncbi:MAG: chromate transporter [Planctomycetes bacterium]|nr:chromate transporter [Planctomycetota bacterium]MCC8115569.1 chromate transporter [Planctomycetota bacterium]MCD7896073.1 chromate transporter [Planctomycetaceae bacterium]
MNSSHGSLFFTFMKIGLFGFGGGYAMLPLIGHEVVDNNGWATTGEFADMVALSQMTPGPVALNTATYVGFTNDGVLGSTIATIGVCLPPFIIMYVVCRYFLSMKDNPRVAGVMRLLRPAVVGLVLAAALVLLNRENFVDWKSGAIFAVAFVLTAFTRLHPIPLLIGAGVAGWLLY